jgi:hypothetical protein
LAAVTAQYLLRFSAYSRPERQHLKTKNRLCFEMGSVFRRLEIEIGRGFNHSMGSSGWLQSMQREKMVPLLKKNDFGGGIVVGVEALADKLRLFDHEETGGNVADEKRGELANK